MVLAQSTIQALKIKKNSLVPTLRELESFYTLRKSLQTTSALSATSKLCFEQPAARFLVCSLIFIEYQIKSLFSTSIVPAPLEIKHISLYNTHIEKCL